MFMAFMSLVVVATVPLAGGRLSRLADLRLRRVGLISLALVLQVAMTEVVPGAPRPVLVALHLGSYAVVAVGLWANRALPGLLLIALGGMTNGLVIALNGGTLPASAGALARAGMTSDPHFANSGVLAHPVLPWLGDVVATPSWLPFRNVISVGDVVVLLGALLLVHGACGSRLPARRPPAARPTPGVATVS